MARDTITVTIGGPRANGKTTLAAVIREVLERWGYEVRVQSNSRTVKGQEYEEEAMREALVGLERGWPVVIETRDPEG